MTVGDRVVVVDPEHYMYGQTGEVLMSVALVHLVKFDSGVRVHLGRQRLALESEVASWI